MPLLAGRLWIRGRGIRHAVGTDGICAMLLQGFPDPVTEYRFAPPPWPRWRFDFAWPAHFCAVEIEGGEGWMGRHVGRGYARDCWKYNVAAVLGWRVLRFTYAMIGNQTSRCRELLGQALAMPKEDTR